MREEHFAILRRHMIEVIGIYLDLAGDELDKLTLDDRVLTAMGQVPRHAFVPSPLAAHAFQEQRCRSASTRRSRSPLSSPS
jgi:protein-L-isoaspartate(D-aspartate) O-methyltransferase